MDKSWMRTSRTKKQYIDGVEAFIKYAVHNLQKMRNIDPRVPFYFKIRIDLSYTKWDKHGEKDEQATTAQIPVNATIEFVDDTDFDMDFGLEIPTDGPATVEMVNATKESFDEDDLAKFQELLLDAEKPLYKGCPDFTKLFAIVKLLNLKGKYGASDKFFTELLGLLKKMLPAGNEMDNKELTVCPTCGISRWKVDNKTHKVYENIPAKIRGKSRLGISADGVDVNSGTRHHSVWPVLSVIYNLPPWLCGLYNVMLHKKKNFNLRAVVLWTINDYPALGTLCGCPYSGFKEGKKKAFNGQQEFQLAPNPLTREQIYNEVQHIENKWGKGKRTNNKTSENQEDTRGRGGKIQKQKRKTTEDEGSSNQVNEAYWKKFNIWYRKLRYWRHNSVPHCIDFMHVEKNVCESLVGTVLNVPGKTKYGMNARLDLAELGIKPKLFARQEEDKTTLPLAGYTLTNAEKDIFCETLSNIRVPQGYCSNFSSLVSLKDRKLIALNAWLSLLMQEVERELAISKDSVSKTVRWISYGPRATIVKYEAYNINGYTFRTKSNDGIVYQNSRVSVEAVDLHISKEVATTRKAFYYGVLQEIWVLDYRFRQIPLFKCDWVNHKAGGEVHRKLL
ncbi:putative reverse transcriptase domain-containing protein [Tanacetum coccineum]